MIPAAVALLWLAASPALAASGVPPHSPGDVRVAFSLAAIPPCFGPGLVSERLSEGWLLSRDRDRQRAAAPANPVLRSDGKKLRAWLELAAFSTVSTVNYWIRDAFPEDRDFGMDPAVQIERIFFLKGWRFDSGE